MHHTPEPQLTADEMHTLVKNKLNSMSEDEMIRYFAKFAILTHSSDELQGCKLKYKNSKGLNCIDIIHGAHIVNMLVHHHVYMDGSADWIYKILPKYNKQLSENGLL
jgi:hypothetical protein